MTNQHPETNSGFCLFCCRFVLFPISSGWNLIDESNCMIFTTDKSLSAPSVLIKTEGTFSNESHLATFSTLTAEFLLGERAALLPPRTAFHRGSAQAQQSLWFKDVKLHLIISLGFFLFFWQRDFLCPSKLFIFVFFWDSGQQRYWKCQNCSV